MSSDIISRESNINGIIEVAERIYGLMKDNDKGKNNKLIVLAVLVGGICTITNQIMKDKSREEVNEMMQKHEQIMSQHKDSDTGLKNITDLILTCIHTAMKMYFIM